MHASRGISLLADAPFRCDVFRNGRYLVLPSAIFGAPTLSDPKIRKRLKSSILTFAFYFFFLVRGVRRASGRGVCVNCGAVWSKMFTRLPKR